MGKLAVVEKEVAAAAQQRAVTIKAPNMETAAIRMRGTAPLVMHKFSKKVEDELLAKHMAGGTSKSKRVREAKNPEELMRNASHISTEGWYGIPCGAFRAALVSACRLVNFKMTLAKQAVFIEADGYEEDGTPLVRIEGTPEMHICPARNDTGVVDVRVRPMFKAWTGIVRIQYDADQFAQADVVNLLMRVGVQVGLLEGRPASTNSCGMGWGTFALVQD